MKFLRKKIVFILALTFCGNIHAQKKVVGAIGFYNVENLFDTEDDPTIADEEFLPEGKKKWTEKNYKDKLEKLSTVIKKVANGADLLGLAEVENKKVVEDLIHTPALKQFDYSIVHKNSPDHRGIDVAIIYKSDRFKVINTHWLKYPEEGYHTRDILLCTGLYFGDTITIGVNHWPSRRSGPAKRNAAGACLRKAVDSINAITKNAKIILLGDFNDDPRNTSIKKELMVGDKLSKLEQNDLFNTSAATYKAGYGTLFYNGAWNLFDQIIISNRLINDSGLSYKMDSFSIFSPPWMKNTNGKYAGGPFRSFSFDKYIGGYSDHFPVYILLEK